LRMYEEGFIDSSTYKKAVETPLTATYHGESTEVKASYVAEMVRNLMIASFGADAYTKGYLVYTTIDSKLQLAADRAVRDALLAYDQRHGYRGAERNWGKFSHKETDDWQAALEKIRPVNGLKPAAVTQVENTEVFALLADGEHITIPWSGLSWARHADSEGHLGAAPKTAHDVVKVGDIIRVQNTEKKTWRLSQVPAVQGAMVSLNPQTGAITSLVGGFDYRSSSFNRVTQAERRPGSGFKPFIYAAALDRGFTLASLINDEPITFGDWEPQNFDDKYRGPTRVREGLIRSINMISIRLLDATGLNHALAFLSHFGFNTAKLPHNLSIALGSGGVTPLEMATGYAVFANGGYKVSPYIIDRVTTADGKLIYQAKPKVVCTHCDQTPAPAAGDSKLLAPKAPPAATTTATQEQYAPRAISPQVAFLMTSALKDVVRMGTAHGALVLKRNDLAGKTGTTNEEVDTWFNGFNSDIVATAWVGFDQPSSLHEYGSRAALPIWIDFMREALAGKPEHTMEEPVDIESVRIDPVSGLLARTGQSNAMFEYFLQGTEPTEVASYAESLPAPIFDATHDDAHYGHDDGELEEDPLF
jgi:penicillin-binding protein 1A